LKDELIYLVVLHLNFSVIGPASQEDIDLLASSVVVAVADGEVGEERGILRLNSNFRVTEDQVEVIVSNGPSVGLGELENFSVGEGHNESVFGGGDFGDEPTFRVGSNQCPIFQLDDQYNLFFVVDVLVEVDFIMRIEGEDHVCLDDSHVDVFC
jgi:hypothetical protein